MRGLLHDVTWETLLNHLETPVELFKDGETSTSIIYAREILLNNNYYYQNLNSDNRSTDRKI